MVLPLDVPYHRIASLYLDITAFGLFLAIIALRRGHIERWLNGWLAVTGFATVSSAAYLFSPNSEADSINVLASYMSTLATFYTSALMLDWETLESYTLLASRVLGRVLPGLLAYALFQQKLQLLESIDGVSSALSAGVLSVAVSIKLQGGFSRWFVGVGAAVTAGWCCLQTAFWDSDSAVVHYSLTLSFAATSAIIGILAMRPQSPVQIGRFA